MTQNRACANKKLTRSTCKVKNLLKPYKKRLKEYFKVTDQLSKVMLSLEYAFYFTPIFTEFNRFSVNFFIVLTLSRIASP